MLTPSKSFPERERVSLRNTAPEKPGAMKVSTVASDSDKYCKKYNPARLINLRRRVGAFTRPRVSGTTRGYVPGKTLQDQQGPKTLWTE